MANSSSQPPEELYGAFNFVVQFGSNTGAEFSECTLPTLEVDVLEQKEGGYNHGVHLLAGPVRAGRLTLKRGVAKSSELLKWYGEVASGTVKTRNLTVVMYDSHLNPVMRLHFDNAYPVKWTGPSFRTSDSSPAIETLELAYGEIRFE
jgi:phage tail-like protein